MEWKDSLKIAEIVYYGRSSFAVECFKDYEVFIDDCPGPAAKGRFKSGHGPQRIKLANPQKLKKIRFSFKSAYPVSNPGASEIEVYAESPPDKALGKFISMKPMQGASG
jgi:hypothetical protein